MSVLCAAIFFLCISAGKLEFRADVLLYSLFFALGYGTAVIGLFFAIKTGPLSLTALLQSYSLIIPTMYGLIFLGDEIDAFLIVGLIALMISLFLVNWEKKSDEKKITPKWIFFVLLSFFGNGCCSVVQKMQQDHFEGAYKNEFMIPALLAVAAVIAIFALILERDRFLPSVKGSGWAALWGLSNGLSNFLVMVLTTRLPASVMYPMISAGGIIISWVIARAVYRERLNVMQNVGVILGIAAVVLLNL